MNKFNAGNLGVTLAVTAAPIMAVMSLNKTVGEVVVPLDKKENDDMYTKNDVNQSDMISAAVGSSVGSVITGVAAAAFPFAPVLMPVLLAGIAVATVGNVLDNSVKMEK